MRVHEKTIHRSLLVSIFHFIREYNDVEAYLDVLESASVCVGLIK